MAENEAVAVEPLFKFPVAARAVYDSVKTVVDSDDLGKIAAHGVKLHKIKSFFEQIHMLPVYALNGPFCALNFKKGFHIKIIIYVAFGKADGEYASVRH